MVANYTTFEADTIQDMILKLDDFLVNHVGWYRIDTVTDTGSDRRYVYKSDGEPDQENTNPRIIEFHSVSGQVRFTAYSTYVNSSTYTGKIFDATNSRMDISFEPIKCRVIADKERVILAIAWNSGGTVLRNSGYLGRINSFYTQGDDPYPNLSKGQRLSSYDWTESSPMFYMLDHTGVQRKYEITTANNMVAAGGTNRRNQKYTFINPTVYFDDTFGYYELRGKLRGVYQVSTRLGHSSFVALASGTHQVLKTSDEADAITFGPLTDGRIGDVNRIPPAIAEVDYSYRGLSSDANTLALWRFDSDVGGTYADETGNYDLTSAGSPSLVNSPLVKAVDLDGSTQSASTTGDGTAATALLGEWTVECVFKPDSFSSAATIIQYGDTGETAPENILVEVSATTSNDIKVLWENGAGTDVSNTTSSAFLLQDRWNYVAVVKKVNGPNYDIEIWHGSFGDEVPVLRETFSSVANAADGSTSDWYIGVTADSSNYFDGQIDDIRVSTVPRSPSEIADSYTRIRL